MLIATPVAVQVGYPFAAHFNHFTRLCSGGDAELLLTVQRGHFNVGTQARLGDIHCQIKQHIVVFSPEEAMGSYMHNHVHVAFRAAVHARFTLSSQADLRSTVNACRNRDRFGNLFPFQTATTAVFTGRRNCLTTTAAGRASAHIDHRAEERLAHLAHLAGSVAGVASDRCRTRFCPHAIANRAHFLATELDFSIDPKSGFFKFEGDIVAQVSAAAGCVARPSAAHSKTKELLENIPEAKVEIEIHAFQPGVTEAIVGCAPFIV